METFAPDTLNQTPSIPLDTLGQVEGAEITAPFGSTTPPVVSDNASSGDGNSLADNGMLPQQSPLDLLSFDGNSSSGGSGTLPSDGGRSFGSGSPMGGGNPSALLFSGGNPFAAGANPVSANGNEIMGNGNWQLIDGQLQSTDANAAGDNLPFGGGNSLFSDGIPLPFGLGEIAVGDSDGSSATNNTTIGNGNWHLGSNNTTLGNGNWQISDDNATIGNGNWNLGSGNATIGNGNWYLANDNAITDNGNATSGSDDIITGSPLDQGDSASLDNKIIIGNDDWVIVADRDAIAGGSDISNDQLIANINALIYQVGLDFVGLLGGSMTFDQPMSTQGTDTNDSNALNSIGNSDEFLASLTGIQANPTGIQADISSDLAIST